MGICGAPVGVARACGVIGRASDGVTGCGFARFCAGVVGRNDGVTAGECEDKDEDGRSRESCRRWLSGLEEERSGTGSLRLVADCRRNTGAFGRNSFDGGAAGDCLVTNEF